MIDFINISEVQLPSCLIDYALSKRPIMEMSSYFEESEKVEFGKFFTRDYQNEKKIENLSQFDIENVCDEFMRLFDEKVIIK